MFIIIIGLECIKIPYKTKSTQAIVFTILNVIIFVNTIEISTTIIAKYPNISIKLVIV